MDSSERVALVTGAGSGLGLAVAAQLLASGARVVAHYRSSRAGLEELQARFGPSCRLVQADLAQPDGALHLYQECLGWGQRLDMLVNNAALLERADWTELTAESMSRALAVNVTAPMVLSRLALADMCSRKWGRIVSVGSIGVKYAGSAQTLPYMVSKAALEAGTLALAKIGAPFQVLVNVVRAGVMKTAMQADATWESRVSLIPLGRAGQPDEVARFICYLLSNENTYLTGAVIPVAGGE